MSTSTTPTDFSDLITAVRNAAREANISGTNTMIKALLNQGLHDLHIQQNWPWAERRSAVTTHAPYTTGSVSIASTARTALEGSGTLWNTTVSGLTYTNLRAGGKIYFGTGRDVYAISSLSSDTAAVIDSAYVGDPAVASAYTLAYASYTSFEDEYALASDFWRLVDLRQFSDVIPIPVISRQEFYRRYPANTVSGKPTACTILELGPSSSTASRPRVLFHPHPDTALHIPYRYITTNLAVSSSGTAAANLSADDDEPIVPLRYRHVLIWYALAHWYRDRKDDARSQEAESHYVDLIRRMAGDTIPERDHPRLVGMRARYLAGSAGPNRYTRRRFTTGSRWDELSE